MTATSLQKKAISSITLRAPVGTRVSPQANFTLARPATYVTSKKLSLTLILTLCTLIWLLRPAAGPCISSQNRYKLPVGC